ncbi:MAG: Proline--tRNA ligase [Candidatus Parcubacteria bacterium]|jgi:prolyl-tRNA editing enzyme YbaK/EbsC (Cys-tRNA(Pro) deacylase)
MPASKKLIVHLGKKNLKFEVVKHKKVYTAYDLAQTLGTELDKVAKTLLVRAELPEVKQKGGSHFVVVVPASYYLELGKLKKLLKAKKVELVFEKGMKKLGIEPGALSPFGSMRGFGVVIDKALLKTKDAFVGAESFTDSLRMKVKDFVKSESPLIGAIGKKNKMKLQKKAAPKRKPKKGKGKPKKGGKKK